MDTGLLLTLFLATVALAAAYFAWTGMKAKKAAERGEKGTMARRSEAQRRAGTGTMQQDL